MEKRERAAVRCRPHFHLWSKGTWRLPQVEGGATRRMKHQTHHWLLPPSSQVLELWKGLRSEKREALACSRSDWTFYFLLMKWFHYPKVTGEPGAPPGSWLRAENGELTKQARRQRWGNEIKLLHLRTPPSPSCLIIMPTGMDQDWEKIHQHVIWNHLWVVRVWVFLNTSFILKIFQNKTNKKDVQEMAQDKREEWRSKF